MSTSEAAIERRSSNRVWHRVYCPHCKEYLSKSCFYRHRQAFYNVEEDKWIQTDAQNDKTSSDSPDITDGSNCEESETEEGSVGSRGMDHSHPSSTVDRVDHGEQLMELSDLGSTSDSSSSSISDSDHEVYVHSEENWPTSESDDESSELNHQPAVIINPIQQFYLFTILWQFFFRVSNSAINCLLRFMKHFVKTLGIAFKCQGLVHTAECMPVGLSTVHKILGISGDSFTRYVVCPKCHSVYEYEDCVIRLPSGTLQSKNCCHIAYPNHPQASRRCTCDTPLLKHVRTKSGTSLQPIKVYAYNSLKKTIENFSLRPGFLDDCEKWRSRPELSSQYLGDIYDGKVWHHFKSQEGNMFLNSPFCYLLAINVDWFQPFERTVYSLGAIYLTLLNLPRKIRYKPENVILVGIMPGPTEAKRNINSYLSPLVVELQHAWNEGFRAMSPQNVPITIRLALGCVACDIPASRKVSGFLGHMASLGCNKCLKKFSGKFGESTDYSGFDREQWTLRSGTLHRQHVNEILAEKTKAGKSAAESKYGCRYSVLLNLPYFNPIEYTVIDVMHNLFLGTGKHMFGLWVERNILTKQHLAELEARIDLFRVPSEVGRLPGHISSQYGAYTANQWRNWILIYSPVVLKGLLPSEHLVCWLLFVRACFLICSPLIRVVDVDTADQYFLQFCRQVELLYGKQSCTANLHLHLHLKQCFLNYGPPHAFWCFSFERYNGILGSYHTNRRSIECQFMKKFLIDQEIHIKQSSSSSSNNERLSLHSLFPLQKDSTSLTVTLADVCCAIPSFLNTIQFHNKKLQLIDNFANNGIVVPLPPFYDLVFESGDVKLLTTLYNQLYPCKQILHFSSYYTLCGRVTLGSDLIGSVLPGGNNCTSSVIMAYWATSGSDLLTVNYTHMNVGVVQKFINHNVTLQSPDGSKENAKHVLAYVKWKQGHPNQTFFGLSATVCADQFEERGVCSFIPVQRIACLAAHAVMQIDFGHGQLKESVYVACPIPIRFYM